ncbi:MAG: sensor histidine kinase [Eubacteriales bacterium]|nr:sensor histidine kinase [Eubacteriales bacterium]
MDLFLKYLKQKLWLFVVGGTFSLIFTVSFFLYHLPVEAVIYPTLLCAFIGLFVLIFDFLRVKDRHKELAQIKSIPDAITATFPADNNIQNEDYREVIRLLCEEHNQYKSETNYKYTDMIDYYTVWAHQIKTPIAAMRLTLQNEDTPLTRKLTNDLYRIEQYVEMVLTFLRLNSDSTDYVFKKYDLDNIVKSAVKKFSSEFIGRKLRLIYDPLNTSVITDEKWLSFVIEQVLSNALKYTPSGSITISLVGEKTLRIEDTGIGIAPSDLPRIFENGYTGFNGRTDKKASGIGLYLCRRVCNNLGHTITANSTVDVGTAIDIYLTQTKLEME